MMRLVLCLLVVLLLSLSTLPLTQAQTALPITVTDASGQEVTITSLDRIVSGSGDVTEIIYELGFYDHLIGVDATATYPEQALTDLPSIGFARTLTVEPIAALNPDVFFCTQTCSPDSVFEQVRQLGIPVVIIPDRDDADLNLPLEKIMLVATALGVPEQGQVLAERVQREIEWVKTATSNVTETPAIFHFYVRGRGLQLAAGTGTPADAMIRGAGAINAAAEAGVEGYQPLSPEIILTAFPDWILLTDGNVEASGGLEAILGFQGLNATPAVKSNQVIVMDTAYLLGMSTHTGRALMQLAHQIHPSMTWEVEVSYPYSVTDKTDTAVTVEDTPTIVIATNPTLRDLIRQLGFHAEIADALPAGGLIIAAESDLWQPLRNVGGTIVVVSDNFTVEEVAAALNVPGRAAALQATTGG